MAIKKPAVTDLIPNPLHRFASYTYAWSLWWLDVKDFNELMSKVDVTDALAWNPGPTSYVLAEDSGLYPNRRHPSTSGLNYHIQDVEFTTAIGPNSVSKSTNLQTGSMTILEPYGVTFIDSLVAASFDGKRFVNYIFHPLMLQLEFKGYDDKGNPISDSQMVQFRKRFPMVIKNMKLGVSTRGAEYKISFAPAGSQGLDPEYEKTPEEFKITASTVEEFFNGPNGFCAKYLLHQANLVSSSRHQYADTMKFDIDPVIGESKIVYDKQLPINLADTKAKNIKLDAQTFSIPKGTSIVDLITRVMSHSSYLINLQLGLEDATGEGSTQKDQTEIFNAFKTQSSIEYAGVDKSGAKIKGVYDASRTKRPMAITYKIHQYPTWNGNHPKIPTLPDSIPYTVKDYNYLYTGKNIDIIDFRVEFNTTYYTAINTYTTQFAASLSMQDTDKDTDANNSADIPFSPSFIADIALPQLNVIPTATPSRYKHVAGDPNATTGMNIKNRPAAVTASDVLQSIYSAAPSGGGGMLHVPMTIVGDPTLIKQDDWLYVPSPTKADEYNSWTTMSQAEFATKHGHLRMDTGQLVVNLTINTPVDIDADITNQGLVYPQPGTRRALFSGQYYILKIVNKFHGGKFEQVLTLARFINGDYPSAYSQKKEAVRTGDEEQSTPGATNDKPLVPTNTATAAGDNTPMPVLQMSDKERAVQVQAAYDQARWQLNVNGTRE